MHFLKKKPLQAKVADRLLGLAQQMERDDFVEYADKKFPSLKRAMVSPKQPLKLIHFELDSVRGQLAREEQYYKAFQVK